MNKPIILDVTIRDGGYLNQWKFTDENLKTSFDAVAKTGIEYIEIGYVDNREGLPVAASWLPEMLEEYQYLRKTQKIAVMCRPTVSMPEKVISERQDYIDLIRIPVDLRNPLLANQLADICLTHQVPFSLNITNISCYSLDHIREAFMLLTDQAKVVYIADSRGALVPGRIAEIFDVLYSVRPANYGFHAHNNLGYAKENTESALEWGVEWIDGSLLGIGLGGRNLDLKDAIDLAAKRGKSSVFYDDRICVTETELGVYPPGEEMELFKWAGIKNFKMEWADMMQQRLGRENTLNIIRNLPDQAMFQPEELRPFVDDNQWNTLVW